MSAKDKLIVALDVQTVNEAHVLIRNLRDVAGMFKIGSQLFTFAGPQLVESIIRAENKVFLDLKFHDIPHQVAGAAQVAAELGVSLFTIHASGGAEMMKRAVDSVAEVSERKGLARSRVVAVSVLTSMDAVALGEIGVNTTPAEAVMRLVKLAESAGVDGVVASPQEAATIRSTTRAGFLIVTPGIRPSTTANEDQKRVATPAAALRDGADYLVVGRPITAAADPVAAAHSIVAEMEAVGEKP